MPAATWTQINGSLVVTTHTGLVIELGAKYRTRDYRQCVYDHITTGECSAWVEGFLITYDLVDQHIRGRESGLDVMEEW